MAKKAGKYKPRRGKSRKPAVALVLAVLVGTILLWIWLSTPVEPQEDIGETKTNSAPVFQTEIATLPTNTLPVRSKTDTPPAAEQTRVPEAVPRMPLPPAVQPSNPPAPAQPSTPRPTEPERKPINLSSYPRAVRSVFEAQVALARQGISSGPVDGLIGTQTRAALAAFQREQGLTITGELDENTKELLILDADPFTAYTVTSNDLGRLQPVSSTWLGKSQQSALEFESILELVSEVWRTHPNYIKKINPGIDWATLQAGMILRVPDTIMPVIRKDASFIKISLSQRLLEVFDAQSNLVAHFPCSIAQRVEKRPAGQLHVVAIAPDPNYTFNPSVFPESAEARQLGRKLILPPGPNNPVGVAWISLDKPGYGIHGTPQPEQVGRTESHGCFRLANWNAAHLLQLVRIGMPVYVQN